MKPEKISIKWKIFIYLLGFTVILLLILWLFQIAYLDSFYKLIKTKEAESVSAQVVELLETCTDEDELSDEIDSIAASNSLTILVTDTDGKTLYNAEYIANSKMSTLPPAEFEQYYQMAVEDGGTTKIEFEGNTNMTFRNQDDSIRNQLENTEREVPEDGGELPLPDDKSSFEQNHGQEMAESVIYVNLVTNGNLNYVVLLNSELTPVDATLHTLKVQLFYISIIMVALSLLIALLMSRKISKSIIKVSSSAQQLAVGNYQVEFDGRDYREIAELSNILNFTTQELEKTESFRRELLANVSHDLRTPLTMIIAYSEVMRDLPGENSPENIQVVIDESKRLTNLVNDMLDISKLQAGVMEKNATVFNLTESIESVFERYNKLKEQEGYTIEFDYQDEVMVSADEFKIYQVIYNLVNNAINYTGKDKTVIVRQVKEKHRVKIEIIDSGEGISENELSYVWDRYYKVDKTHKRALAGTGLGLSIVKNILELHNAEYGVESQVGKGSIFWFALDILEDE